MILKAKKTLRLKWPLISLSLIIVVRVVVASLISQGSLAKPRISLKNKILAYIIANKTNFPIL